MENYEKENVGKFLNEIGMDTSDIEKILSNPVETDFFITQIALFLKEEYSIDPEEFGSMPYETFADRLKDETEELPNQR